MADKIQRKFGVNINPKSISYRTYKTKRSADHYATFNRIACVEVVIEFEEGEGL